MNLTSDGLTIFNSRYAAKDDNGQVIETPAQAVVRISHIAAQAEKDPTAREYWEAEFKRIIDRKWFIPSTPIWDNMGKPNRMPQPAACFVLEVQDNLQSMYQTLLESAMIAKYGGGIGYNFSAIRPQGDLIHSTKGIASGPVELIRLYNYSAAMIKEGGIRHGAYMGILDCSHPDIEEFITSKLAGELTNFGLSVGITDEFMRRLAADEDWNLQFKGEIRKTIPARQLWQHIVYAAWSCGDPGLIFLDRIQAANPIPGRPISATNPCGEQPLSPGESCLLGSINLALMVHENGTAPDWSRLQETARIAVRFLDNLIDVGEYPFDFITAHTRASRKIGLGIMGLHDLLIQLGLPYDTQEGRELSSKVMAFIRTETQAASAELGLEKGNFPLWEESIFAKDNQPRRNASCLTIAPTGTTSLLAGVEGYSIEPIFAVAYHKTYFQEGAAQKLSVVSPLFLAACKERGLSASALQAVTALGSCQGVTGIPADVQQLFKVAREIAPLDHLAMQAVMQKQVDNAISKTINLPPTTGVDMVSRIYTEAWQQGLKGITIFREGSKKGIIEIGEPRKTMEEQS
jgi:ribonucleoside-diphosphate reductase alpha chain